MLGTLWRPVSLASCYLIHSRFPTLKVLFQYINFTSFFSVENSFFPFSFFLVLLFQTGSRYLAYLLTPFSSSDFLWSILYLDICCSIFDLNFLFDFSPILYFAVFFDCNMSIAPLSLEEISSRSRKSRCCVGVT